MKVLNGQELAGFIKERQAKQVRGLRQAYGVLPRLAIVTDSDNPVIQTYMRLKQAYGADILIDVEIHQVASDELATTITELNARDAVQGIIVQLPLRNPAMTDEILGLVAPEKDVDGLRPDGSKFDAATPIAINWLLAGYSIELAGKRLAIIGRGRLVGGPLAAIWQRSGFESTVFEKGDDLSALRDYDVIVTATGVPGIITSPMVRSGAVLVDAGTASDNGKIVGDAAPAVRARQDIHITPEKGGVGPLTVSALFDNVIQACLTIANANR
ncbi:MAG: bifunctional 5,10-methylenetetrahydrofolate dehydrogenase/5,10-methenyltetrahydrofolate cyclohydrolase [Candidatus Saccharibacteria bacterium]|nr:bifunctional 5,10-methylenetetrahydrofolate dehydrogenase/5,10-methenyltetrahydrofolate cyclohydrolase [Candidatus Saccharibacteria bacterium]